MAPSSTCALPLDIQAVREKSRLKKPLVEKLRRDRINSSIEQLKHLLAKEFQRHQPSSKLEKADVLEMTVSYLRHRQPVLSLSSVSMSQDYSKGYSSCLRETLSFLAAISTSNETQSKLLIHFQKFWGVAKDDLPHPRGPSMRGVSTQNASSKPTCVLWRPW